ncbi:MAG: hypothetical protein KDN22_01190 [Verrucomicrobiae bacterium]|nr:hypothetical protein [Verrucomicrobiae bacterium]
MVQREQRWRWVKAVVIGAIALTGELSVSATAAPPANDDFENRIDLGSAREVSITVSTAEATHEIGEPEHLAQPAIASLWWKWTAASNSSVEIRMGYETSQWTRIAVYEGDTLRSLKVASLDRPKIGTTYSIALDVDPDSFSDAREVSLRFRQFDDYSDTAAESHDVRIEGIPFSFTPTQRGTTIVRWRPPDDGIFLANVTPPLPVWIRKSSDPRPIGIIPGLIHEAAPRSYMFEADSSLDITFEFNWIALDPPTIEVNALNVPSNDRVDDAVDLGTAAIVSATGSNHRATTDDQEARLTDSNTPVVWWRWTAPHSGVFALDSTGTDFFHSILVVREPGTSTQEQEWQRLLRVDGIGEPFPNKQPIAFTADMGATYLLGIGGNT